MGVVPFLAGLGIWVVDAARDLAVLKRAGILPQNTPDWRAHLPPKSVGRRRLLSLGGLLMGAGGVGVVLTFIRGVL